MTLYLYIKKDNLLTLISVNNVITSLYKPWKKCIVLCYYGNPPLYKNITVVKLYNYNKE